jgi:hypothetical protein
MPHPSQQKKEAIKVTGVKKKKKKSVTLKTV